MNVTIRFYLANKSRMTFTDSFSFLVVSRQSRTSEILCSVIPLKMMNMSTNLKIEGSRDRSELPLLFSRHFLSSSVASMCPCSDALMSQYIPSLAFSISSDGDSNRRKHTNY